MVMHTTSPVVSRRAPVRPSPEQIDAAILDTAAEVFARHGFAGTSVQQVADAVGYSKTGLLRRFPSKQALYDAAVEHVTTEVRALRGRLEGQGPARRRGFLASAAAAAFARPGVVLLMIEALQEGADLPHADRLDALAHDLLAALTEDLAEPHDRLRAVMALQLVANTALLTLEPQAPLGDLPPAQVQELAVEAAVAVLGAGPAPA
ncbi:TetR/AcrR family transcriptional regulator [Aquipuribacter sp. SD81]|uniref:TetR/AcrR family transcriptional regulator n=1 Tax=Aquipuribacter sp. SD81 TaxID=3127703 RepID=UPI003015D196